jgi:hypothetical protein
MISSLLDTQIRLKLSGSSTAPAKDVLLNGTKRSKRHSIYSDNSKTVDLPPLLNSISSELEDLELKALFLLLSIIAHPDLILTQSKAAHLDSMPP